MGNAQWGDVIMMSPSYAVQGPMESGELSLNACTSYVFFTVVAHQAIGSLFANGSIQDGAKLIVGEVLRHCPVEMHRLHCCQTGELLITGHATVGHLAS